MQSQKDSFQLTPIGEIRSVFDHKFGTPRQGLLAPHGRASFKLTRLWRDKGMFDGLEGFSHVWLVSLFHQNKNVRGPSKIHPPRLLGRAVGVLASRSPHHPNNLGLTLAKLDRVEGDTLWLSGIDLIDGTPILDIKPYLAEADRPAEFSCGWADTLAPTTVPCEFSTEALLDLEHWCGTGRITNREQFIGLVEDVLRLDPRPLSYRARSNEKFAVVLGGLDIHARFHDNKFTVISIQPFKPGLESDARAKALGTNPEKS